MEVDVRQAIKMFFSKSSFEMIYQEAFANALDANATQVNITIDLDDVKQLQNLKLTIEDNGEGFTDKRYSKFSKLLNAEEKSHKGLGRLVYLCYFDNVNVESYYEKSLKRSFYFHEDFNGEDNNVETVTRKKSGSIFTFTGFNGEKLGKNCYVDAKYIKRVLVENFMMRFYQEKLNRRNIKLTIKTNIGGVEKIESFTNKDLPNFEVKRVEGQLNLFDDVYVLYHISERDKQLFDDGKNTFITALSIDDRCFPVDIVVNDRIPQRYDMIFLLRSKSLQNTTDGSRQNMKLSETDQNLIKNIFRKAVSSIINQKIPEIAANNRNQYKYFNTKYPHLAGLIDQDAVGYVSNNDLIKQAQDVFFKTEREILGAEHLDDERFNKSLEFASRTLAAYIIYRQKMIDKMKGLDKSDLEADLHNLLAPKRRNFKGDELVDDIYSNNIWIMDDRFMTYEYVMSEREMVDVIGHIDPTDNNGDDDRPDIVVFFSRNPTEDGAKFDMVIVELKRLGLKPELNSIIELQLDKRTQLLAKHYGNRIQRAWYYGILEMTDDYRMHLKNNQYKPLFSHGDVYHKTKPVYVDLQDEVGVIQHSYIMDFKALVDDADARNSAFLRIIQDRFSKDVDMPF